MSIFCISVITLVIEVEVECSAKPGWLRTAKFSLLTKHEMTML